MNFKMDGSCYIEKLNRIERLLIIGIFVLVLAEGIFYAASLEDLRIPFSLAGFSISNASDNPKTPLFHSDFVSEDDILVYPDRVVIKINGASVGRYDDSGSMRPVIDSRVNGIRIKPESENDINVGDIVTFKRNNQLIVHRVIEKGADDKGIYFITKGDNNDFPDRKIRIEDIEYLTVGLLY